MFFFHTLASKHDLHISFKKGPANLSEKIPWKSSTPRVLTSADSGLEEVLQINWPFQWWWGLEIIRVYLRGYYFWTWPAPLLRQEICAHQQCCTHFTKSSDNRPWVMLKETQMGGVKTTPSPPILIGLRKVYLFPIFCFCVIKAQVNSSHFGNVQWNKRTTGVTEAPYLPNARAKLMINSY